MKASSRLSSPERREAIVEAVKRVFAEKGFDGTTTRELAKAAGVSEALIYKHFSSKGSLYAAMLDACAKGPAFVEFNRILTLEPSTATLVIMVYFTIFNYVHSRSGDDNKAILHGLLVRSLLEDGAFVRMTHEKFAGPWIRKFGACLNKAAKAGELREVPVRGDLRVWFVHHVGFSLMLHLRPPIPAVDYKTSMNALVEQATWFALLGIGLKDETIKRYYSPKALSLLAS
jgi:AcrR family transcriptional regulator